jgi:hypothetical protein
MRPTRFARSPAVCTLRAATITIALTITLAVTIAVARAAAVAVASPQAAHQQNQVRLTPTRTQTPTQALAQQSQTNAPTPKSRKPPTPATKSAPARPMPVPAPAPKVERPVPFKPGERLSYDISWSTFLTAATATVSVNEKRPSYDSIAYYIVAEGQPTAFVAALYKLYYKADTLLDAYTLLPQRGSLYSREAGRQHLRATRFLQEARKAQYDVQSGASLTHTDAHVELSVPPSTQEALSAVFALRAMELRPGATMVMPVSINGEIYRVQVAIANKESITCGLGTVTAWKLIPSLVGAQGAQGEPEAQNMAIWISDDGRRLPVLMQADFPVGTFRLTLRSASGV